MVGKGMKERLRADEGLMMFKMMSHNATCLCGWRDRRDRSSKGGRTILRHVRWCLSLVLFPSFLVFPLLPPPTVSSPLHPSRIRSSTATPHRHGIEDPLPLFSFTLFLPSVLRPFCSHSLTPLFLSFFLSFLPSLCLPFLLSPPLSLSLPFHSAPFTPYSTRTFRAYSFCHRYQHR